MIVALVAFGFALGQVLLERELVSKQKKFIFGIVVIVLSAIPLAVQLVILSGELARARKYSVKLLLHRLMMNIAGDYGPASNLLVKQYRQRTFRDELYCGSYGLWRCILFVGHCLAKFYGLFPFGDPFSGVFTVRFTSVALWMDDAGATWDDCERPKVVDEVDLFSGPRVKDVRDVSLTVEFKRIEGQQSTEGTQSEMVHCYIFATGSRDNAICKLYYESLWKGECRIENARELSMLMGTLNNDSFIVKGRPPDGNHILSCEEELKVIVESILSCDQEGNRRGNQKLNAKRVTGRSYV